MLGSQFLKLLSGNKDFEMFAFDREQLDISDFQKLEATIHEISPDFVINCCAYTDVDTAEEESEVANKVNGEAVARLAISCSSENAKLIHFSTDYVFDGEDNSGYSEEDQPNPINEYGRSKLKGENAIMNNLSEYYIIRTSWLFGENGKNFVTTMLRLAQEKDSLAVVDDQIGAPTYTNDLVKAVMEFFLMPYLTEIEEHHKRFYDDQADSKKDKLPFGIYHLTNSGSTSWFGFAKEIFKLSGHSISLKAVRSDKFVRPARRPKCSILRSSKLDAGMRPWQVALKAYLDLIS